MAATRVATKSAPLRLKITFWLDTTLLVSVCVLQAVRFTGLVLHEWFGIAIIGLILVHLLLAWSWIATQSRRLFDAQTVRGRVNYLLNLALLGAVTAVIFSGILISRKAIPALTGTAAPPDLDWRWDRLHSQFSDLTLMLTGLHLAINWDWLIAAIQNIFRRFREGAL